MVKDREQTTWIRLGRWYTIAGLLIFFGLGLSTIMAKAPTVDEYVHILRGRVLWQTADFRFQQGHAPLAHWLIGALLGTDPTLPHVTELPSWGSDDRFALGQEFLWQSGPAPTVERILLLARLPVLWAGLLTGALLVRWLLLWQRRQYGRMHVTSVLLLITFFAFSPNLLASFSLATTDALLVLTWALAMFALWWTWQQPVWSRWLLAGGALGLALATKLSALALGPIFLVICLWQWGRRGWLWPLTRWQRPLAQGLLLLLGTALTLWTAYAFEWRPTAVTPFPLPAASYLESFFSVQTHVQTGHVSYLLGERSADGWWHYFLVAFLFKTPATTLALLLGALGTLAWQRRLTDTLYFWLPAAALLLSASVTRLNIGYRHILPVLPFVWLLVATAVPFWLQKRGVVLLLVLGLAVYVFGSVRQQPHTLSYFNEFVGGSRRGSRYLGDSNLDWGQDLNRAADYARAQAKGRDVYLSYYGSGDWTYYGLDTLISLTPETGLQHLNPANPAPGLYLISVSHLQGLGLHDPDLLDWFRRREPDAYIGNSIQVYEVSQPDAGDWIAYCLEPAPLLDPPSAQALVGQSDVRNVYFDCRQSWVLPQAGTPGWYILPQQEKAAWPAGDAFAAQFELVYRHAPGLLGPSFDVYHWAGGVDVAAWVRQNTAQTAVIQSSQQSLPQPVGEVANLLGYTVAADAWTTIWQVTRTPDGPLTVAAHLYRDAPTPAVADSLGFTSEQWQPGDIFWQMHRFAPEANGRTLETGFYNYLTGEGAPFIRLPHP